MLVHRLTNTVFPLQAPDGLIFPDRATLYVCAIEDRQYKDEKINCELEFRPSLVMYFLNDIDSESDRLSCCISVFTFY